MHPLWVTSVLVSGLLLLSAVAGRLPFLAAYQAASLLRTLLLAVSPGGTAYYWTWLYTEPGLVALRAGFAIEAYLLVTRPYRDMGWWRAGFPLGAALLASLAVGLGGAGTPLYASLELAYEVARYSWAVLALGMVGAWMVAAVPATRPRWVAAHYWLAVAYCFSQAIPAAWAYARGTPASRLAAGAMLIGATTTQVAWAWSLWALPRRQRQPAPPH